jgi:membrane protease YdiL (CAAX protease family)
MTLIRRYPLILYFVLAYAITWILTVLGTKMLVLAILGLFGPALAAIIVTWVTEGRAAVGQLLRRVVQGAKPIWFLIAFGLPIVLILLVDALALVLGLETKGFLPLTMIEIIIGVLVVGEEIGWRGFALPRLLKQYSPLVASLILGIVWVFWHLPNFVLPELGLSATPFIPYMILVVMMTILFTWVYQNTAGSLLIATLFHALNNIAAVLLIVVDTQMGWWLKALVYALAAGVVVVTVRGFRQRAS